jgi:hypothetical protein
MSNFQYADKDTGVILEMYSVSDIKGKLYMQPFLARTRGEAIRSFTEAIKDKNTMISKYPEDYNLYKIGLFNQNTGILKGIEHESLGKASDFITE